MSSEPSRPRLHTLVCSTRPGRIGPALAAWAHAAAQLHGGFDASLVDLASFALPMFDEPEHPKLQRYQHPHTRAWSESVALADAFVFVMPEYNHGPPAALLNALNYLIVEWQYKPVGFVSYGGVSGGLRGVQVTKQLLTTLKMVPVLEGVVVPMVEQYLAADRACFKAKEIHAEAAGAMLTELRRWTSALGSMRTHVHVN